MENVRQLIIIAVAAGIVVGVLARADAATKIIGAVSSAYRDLITTVANVPAK